MGNSYSFFRLSAGLLDRPATRLPVLAEWLKNEPEWLPADGEDIGHHLERLLIDRDEDALRAEYLRTLGARMTFHADFVGESFTQLHAVIRAYGDLDLLAFLLDERSRTDVLAHLERLPTRARRLGLANDAVCMAPSETHALAAALATAKQDGFRKLPRDLRWEQEGLSPALVTPGPQKDELDLWLFSGGNGGALELDSLPQRRGVPPEPRVSYLDKLRGRFFPRT